MLWYAGKCWITLWRHVEILGLDEPDLPKWKELRSKLPDFLLDEDGAVKEWSFKYSGENYDHRHVSHHYDIWPGRAISPEKTPELVKPFILSNRKRGHQTIPPTVYPQIFYGGKT